MSNPITDFPWEKVWVNGTLTPVARPCHLHSIVLNGVTTVGGTITVYDALDATDATLRMAVYDILGASVSYQGITFLYDCKIETGIHIVFTTVVGNLTVMYK